MAKATLPVNFKDDILASSMGGKRRYILTDNGNGTYSLEDATTYTQTGSDFGASQMNQTNQAVNQSCDKSDIIDDYDDLAANKASGKMAGALAVSQLIGKSYTPTTGDLGLATRKYTLKRYHDGTFDLRGRLDASQVDLSYSASTGKYYALMTAQLPSELTLADNDYVFTGSVESSGIYSVSLNSIQNKTMNFYLSADVDPGRIPLIRIGFKLEGNWK